MTEPAQRLADRIGHRFNDPTLLDAALTHRSVSGSRNNERLEFLGDALLSLVIADELHARVPDADEGDLSRLRASLVRRSTLAEIAREIELGEWLSMGSGELKSGGHRRASTLADALEALFGAVYRDAGFDATRRVVVELFRSRLENLPNAASLKDAKTRLQEVLQSRSLALPDYAVVEVSGRAHESRFEVVCRIDALGIEAHGAGSSRKRAEQRSAQRALERLTDA